MTLRSNLVKHGIPICLGIGIAVGGTKLSFDKYPYQRPHPVVAEYSEIEKQLKEFPLGGLTLYELRLPHVRSEVHSIIDRQGARAESLSTRFEELENDLVGEVRDSHEKSARRADSRRTLGAILSLILAAGASTGVHYRLNKEMYNSGDDGTF